jgi:hypothetical protein
MSKCLELLLAAKRLTEPPISSKMRREEIRMNLKRDKVGFRETESRASYIKTEAENNTACEPDHLQGRLFRDIPKPNRST